MKRTTLNLLRCPQCHSELTVTPEIDMILSGALHGASCRRSFVIRGGIPNFMGADDLQGNNRRFVRMYNWLSWIYRAFTKIAFAYIGMSEEAARREITDRLNPRGGHVLEVSIGPGVNLPYLIGRPDIGDIFGLDISPGQLARCRSFINKKGWDVDLFCGNGEKLPFRDETFDGVFHIGGINYFNDKQAAIQEMIRVARPGTRILISDETEKGAQAYEKTIPGFKRSSGSRRSVITAPIDLVPEGMLETRLFDVWKGWLYCLEFRKP